MHYEILRCVRVLAVAALSVASANAQAVAHYWADRFSPTQPVWIEGAGDVSGDGVPDFVLADGNSGDAEIWSGVDLSLVRVLPGCGGWDYVLIGDLDGDGLRDLLVGSPFANTTGPPVGAARIHSIATGALIREHISGAIGGAFGTRVFGAGDVDGDGSEDYAVSSGNPWVALPSQAELFSGATGTRIFGVSSSTGAIELIGAGDVDADGFGDVMIAEPYHSTPTQYGRVRVYSVRSGSVLYEYFGNVTGPPYFGRVCASAGDVDQDGHGDFLIGREPYVLNGCVDVHSGANGNVLRSLCMQATGSSQARYQSTHLIGDVDGDGLADIAVAGDRLVDFFSAATGAFILECGTGQPLGSSSDAGDLNGDGRDDTVLCAPSWTSYFGTSLVYTVLMGCPAPQSYCTAKMGSSGCVPRINLRGSVSLSVGDELHVTASDVRRHSNGALRIGATAAALPFHGGTLCVAPSASNLLIAPLAAGGNATGPCTGRFDVALPRPFLQSLGLPPGTVLYAQFISRDPGLASPDNFGLTDAFAITIAP